ncbi:S8 family serine peptidase [Aliiglaciecola sp. CAU 1673]|uniref:S8 family serine peptidase n=1 Tax=Aliiglaciecola sp. CAU 1673 TaxID=3032595 RepID=UPI0023DC2DD8|nr:S8 family serine peptidase [Aliiglaciecola sp. CAU 1673]MDF2180412.1 S8 family serine peptidase [Aliiglaciecola sp. CAU 1673]
MINKPSNILFSSLALAVMTAMSATATELKPADPAADNSLVSASETSFADWLAKRGSAAKLDTTDRMIIRFEDSQLVNAFEALSGKAQGLDKAVDQAKLQSAQQILKSLNKQLGEQVQFVRGIDANQGVFALAKEKSVKDINQLAMVIAKMPGVATAEADPKRYPLAQNQPWGISAVQANQVSDNDAANRKVCIIDSGYDINNPDLSGNQHAGTNDSGTGNWYVPGGSHGTHVAGTIAAINNTQGVVGVMPNQNVKLHIVKVFSEAGWSYSSDLVTAVNTCKNNGANVVNMSLGGPSSSTSESNGMASAYNGGVLLVAAAGNDGNSTHSYPASYDAVISVAAVDETGLHAEFSQYTSQVELSGPGEAILSTVGLGDGRQGYLTWGSNSAGDDRVLPHSRYVQSGTNYVNGDINASVNGTLAACTTSGTSFSCGNMSGKICVVERAQNQSGSTYPEINPIQACQNAGAVGAVVYSKSDRPGLQNPYLVDGSGVISIPSVSVNRTLGQQLAAAAGTSATLQTVANTNYAYYNGTSMASPHVAGVAALAWSKNPTCTASQVRTALRSTAVDLDTAGRDNRTGYGLVQTKAASDYMAANCSGTTPPPTGPVALTNGVAQSNLSAAKDASLDFTLAVPANATDLSFAMSGGSGDADLYVKFGSAPTTSSYDCRSWNTGNSETCNISTAQQGTYYVKVVAYAAFSGASLTGSYTEPTSGGGTGGTASATNISANKNAWKYYTLDIPAGMKTLTVTTSGGSGDADLYLRLGSNPTTSTYTCRSWASGNAETCTISNPTAGTWNIGLYGYRAFSGVTLNAQWQP